MGPARGYGVDSNSRPVLALSSRRAAMWYCFFISFAVGAMGGVALSSASISRWHRGSKSLVGDVMLVRGGAVDTEIEPTVKVTVLTAAGSPMLDLKARLELPLSTTVGELKAAVEAKMAGRPPVARQRLVFGPKLLADDAATLGSLLAPAPADTMDEFDDEDDATGDGVGAMPRDLSIMLDMVPPLPIEKSPPAALEAKLKAYAAELVAVRFLSNQLTAAVQRESAVQAHQDGSGEEVSEGTASSGDGADAAEEGDGAGEAVSLVTGGLRDEIRAMEAYVFGLVGSNLAKRKLVIHSAIAEDGRVDATMDGQSAAEAGPWKVLARSARHHCDVDWASTLRNVGTCLLIAKFGAHGPQEASVIVACAVGLVVWQTRPVRRAMKLGFAFAAQDRDAALVDLFATLLPTSHRALLEAQDSITLP